MKLYLALQLLGLLSMLAVGQTMHTHFLKIQLMKRQHTQQLQMCKL